HVAILGIDFNFSGHPDIAQKAIECLAAPKMAAMLFTVLRNKGFCPVTILVQIVAHVGERSEFKELLEDEPSNGGLLLVHDPRSALRRVAVIAQNMDSAIGKTTFGTCTRSVLDTLHNGLALELREADGLDHHHLAD